MKRALALTALLSGALVGLTVPGCTRDPSRSLRFMIWGAPEEIRVVQGYLDEFERAHPEIDVVVEHAPSMGYTQKLQTLVRGDNLPDVMYLGEGDLPWMVESNAVLDLTDLAARDRAQLEPDDFYPVVHERFQLGGRQWGIAKDFATLVLYYNRDLFDKWDVPYPQAGWTWDDFLAKAQAVSREGDYGFLVETWAEELYPWVWQAGGRVADEATSTWLLGDEEHLARSAEGLQFVSDLIWKHKVAPPPSVTRDAGGNALFKNGRVAMCTYGRWACMEFKEIEAFDWDTVELPRQREQATSLFGVCYAIGARTQLPEESWTLLKFLTSKDAQAEVAHSGQAIPSRQSVAESEAFLHPRAFGERQVDSRPHFTQVPVGHFGPRFPTVAQVKSKLSEALEPLWNQPPSSRGSALEILREAQPQLAAIARGELSGQPAVTAADGEPASEPAAPPSRIWVLSLLASCGLGGVALKLLRG